MNVRQLTPEESAALDAKYGKPLGPIGSIRRNPVYPTYEHTPKITKDQYLHMKEEGMKDDEIRQELNLPYRSLGRLKKLWMISTRVTPKGKEKGECKLCENTEFVKGFCKQHYFKQWRWNHVN